MSPNMLMRTHEIHLYIVAKRNKKLKKQDSKETTEVSLI